MVSPTENLATAAELLQKGEAEQALGPASSAAQLLSKEHGASSPLVLPALTLLSEIQLELGDTTSAYESFRKAALCDPDGTLPEEQGGGPEKFLYLAQLDEAGGESSLAWFEKAVSSLEQGLALIEDSLLSKPDDFDLLVEREEKRTKLAHALCGMCELWMTDLSFSDAAETQCENLVTQAVLLQPDDAQTLQTLASIRLSQGSVDDARAALTRSLELWSHLPPGHPSVPDFAVRIALARTLMEAGMEGDALEVCERLVGEDDQSVESWYLGGWCQHLTATASEEADDGEGEGGNESKDTAMKDKEGGDEDDEEDEGPLSPEDKKAILLSSREWLRNCLRLCQLLEYEDERMRDHAKELVDELDKDLGDAEIEDDEEEWDGIQSESEGESHEEGAEMDES